MKTYALSLIFLVFTSSAILAQPTLTSNDIPTYGSMLTYRSLYSFGDDPFSFTEGENQTWSITPNDMAEEVDTIMANYINPSDVPGSEIVTGCNLIIQYSYSMSEDYEDYEYVSLTPQALTNLGYSAEPGMDIELYEDPELVFELPLNYGDAYADTSYDSFTEFVGGQDIDSIRFVFSSIENGEVVGWGTLNIDGMVFNALMVREIYEYADTVYHFTNGNWALESTNAYPPEESYIFIDPQLGGIVAYAGNSDEGKGGVATYLTYLIESDLTNSISAIEIAGLKAFPNPTSNQTVLTGLERGDMVSVYDLSGRLIFDEEASSNQHTIITSGLDNGIYTVRVNRKNSFGALRLVVTH